MDEQSDTWPLLRGNDRKSRHRRIKKQRRYERLAATSQFLSTNALVWVFPPRPSCCITSYYRSTLSRVGVDCILSLLIELEAHTRSVVETLTYHFTEVT